MQARNWLFTENNPENPPVFGEGVRYVYQKERGEEGTVHYQGYCEFRENVRLSGLKKIISKAHWEVRKGSQQQAYDYCTKSETRIEEPVSNFTPAVRQGQRNDLSGARAIILGKRTAAELYQDPDLDEVMMKYPKYALGVHLHRPIVPMEDVVLWAIQQEIVDLATGPVHPRKIHWRWCIRRKNNGQFTQ